jgi:hypothetical protein
VFFVPLLVALAVPVHQQGTAGDFLWSSSLFRREDAKWVHWTAHYAFHEIAPLLP